MIWLSLMLAGVLALVHLLAERMGIFRAIPRSSWLSAASGASVAYVFVHIFPLLGAYQQLFTERASWTFIEHHVYLLALMGFCVYYGLERAVQRHGGPTPAADAARPRATSHRLFWVHVAAFALYYALIGYLLVHRDAAHPLDLLMYAMAMGMHFMVIDVGLSARQSEAYHRYGRWMLSAAVLVGWGLAVVHPLDEMIIGGLFAFLAGGIVLNAIKEELPADRHSRFLAFGGGAVGFGALLLVTVEMR